MTPPKSSQKKRFARGARVVVGMSRQVGTVLHVDDEPSIMGEYVHVIQTNGGQLTTVGCDIELVPTPQTNLEPAAPTPPSTAPSEGPDRKFMRLAIEEARKSVPEDGRAHPKVGVVIVKVVIVKDGKVLASAHRGEIPQCHAEYIVLEKKLADVPLSGATVYTTLEPCTSRNDPKVPCADRLAERKVGRVLIGMLDPNPDIRGRGDQVLSDAGIETQLFPRELRAQVEDMNREFIRSQKDRQASAKMPRRTKISQAGPTLF
jgi:pyrimidine deaminase RibD-like protein